LGLFSGHNFCPAFPYSDTCPSNHFTFAVHIRLISRVLTRKLQFQKLQYNIITTQQQRLF
jgi:hypothetical protein